MVFWLSVFGSHCIGGGGGVGGRSKQVFFVLFVFGFVKEFCPRLLNREMFSKPGRAKIQTNPCEIESCAKIRHKSVMPSDLQMLTACWLCTYYMYSTLGSSMLQRTAVQIYCTCNDLWKDTFWKYMLC